jgi:rod shape-determining protein MreC
MRKKRLKARFFLIVCTIALLLTFTGIYTYSKGSSSFLGNAIGVAVTPIRKLNHFAGARFADIAEHFENVDRLKNANDSLRKENKKLQKENEQVQLVRSENKWLRGFLELKRERTDMKLTDAKVIARGAEGFITSFTLDKGSTHGIKKNMTVITSDKTLVGIITETGLTYSRGITVLSYDCAAGVYIERTSVPAVLSGDFALMSEGKCFVKGLPEDTDIVVGDNIYTSGLGGVLPKDLYVGKVSKIVSDPLTYTISAIIEPSFDLLSLDRVMIVTNYKSSYE